MYISKCQEQAAAANQKHIRTLHGYTIGRVLSRMKFGRRASVLQCLPAIRDMIVVDFNACAVLYLCSKLFKDNDCGGNSNWMEGGQICTVHTWYASYLKHMQCNDLCGIVGGYKRWYFRPF